jgi:hypothetical protein
VARVARVQAELGEDRVDVLAHRAVGDDQGGPAYLFDVTARTATVTTGGGAGRLQFDAAPGSVVLSTDGGPAQLDVPRGPYALTSDSDGGPVTVTIATSPSASRTLAVTSGGGLLQVDHATGTQ